MSLLSLSGLAYEFASTGQPALFRGVSFSIDAGDRIAITGANGSGKSTLLRLLAAHLEPTEGVVVRRRGLRVAFAEQHRDPHAAAMPLFDYVCAGCNDVFVEAEAARILAGLGFDSDTWDRPTGTFSGGEWSRAQLARALSNPTDILLLDEPSNHLDDNARMWLEGELASERDGAILVATHDRALLDAFANRVVEIERGRLRVFDLTYREYRDRKRQLNEQEWAEYEAFGRRKAAMEAAAQKRDRLAVKVATTPPGARYSKDFYARKAALVARTGRLLRERVNRPEAQIAKPWEEQPIDGLTFEHVVRSGDVVLTASGLSKSFDGQQSLFRDLSFHLRRGGRLVVAGANGSGKTTLLRILEGREQADAGDVRFGANVEIGSVAQMLDHQFDLAQTPLEICGSSTNARTLLACLKVPVTCLNRPLRSLSGGERTKVALANLLNSRANLLLLDEPTNHLEVEALEALEAALARYPGAIIAVSHDRAFVESLGPAAERIELKN